MGCVECLGRVPFASLIAMVLTCVGVGVFCGSLYEALRIVLINIFEELFWFRIDWLTAIQITFIVVAVVMGLFSIILLVFGFLATGATRDNVYARTKCMMGGKCSAIVFMGISYIMNIGWMGVSCAMTIPVFLYVFMKAICDMDLRQRVANYQEDYCFNLTRIGIFRDYTESKGSQNALCTSGEIRQLCDNVDLTGPYFGAAFGGALLIVLGLTLFVVILTANYTRIKISKELTEYRDAVNYESTQLDQIITNSKAEF